MPIVFIIDIVFPAEPFWVVFCISSCIILLAAAARRRTWRSNPAIAAQSVYHEGFRRLNTVLLAVATNL